MKFSETTSKFNVRLIWNTSKVKPLKRMAGRLVLFALCLFVFLAVTELPLRGEVDYLEKMGVIRLNEAIDAPGFRLSDLEGNKVSLSEYRGNFVMLNFWATW